VYHVVYGVGVLLFILFFTALLIVRPVSRLYANTVENVIYIIVTFFSPVTFGLLMERFWGGLSNKTGTWRKKSNLLKWGLKGVGALFDVVRFIVVAFFSSSLPLRASQGITIFIVNSVLLLLIHGVVVTKKTHHNFAVIKKSQLLIMFTILTFWFFSVVMIVSSWIFYSFKITSEHVIPWWFRSTLFFTLYVFYIGLMILEMVDLRTESHREVIEVRIGRVYILVFLFVSISLQTFSIAGLSFI